MRLFIAIEFSEIEKTALMQSAAVLRASCARGNFSLRENYHLTLRFLGEVPPANLKRITAAMDECRMAAFDATVGRLGRFRRDGGDIFWREISAPRALNDLHRELSQKLAAAGFPPEERAFKPHLTLAREAVLRQYIDRRGGARSPDDLHAAIDRANRRLREKESNLHGGECPAVRLSKFWGFKRGFFKKPLLCFVLSTIKITDAE